jgi:hypothetical protein
VVVQGQVGPFQSAALPHDAHQVAAHGHGGAGRHERPAPHRLHQSSQAGFEPGWLKTVECAKRDSNPGG